MEFRPYRNTDYQSLCDFLIELNRNDRSHINWNWARLEWMIEHPEFDKSTISSIGLWLDNGRIVGAAIYDMYFGEAFCAALPLYIDIYGDILDYAYCTLRDENGLGVAINDKNIAEIEAAEQAGFVRAEQDETVMRIPLDKVFPSDLPDGLRFRDLDPAEEPYDFGWLLWQGFDHDTDRAVFEREDKIIPRNRPHLDPHLSVTAVNADGAYVGYCCLWYSEKTDYAYVEPVCVIPSYRSKGVAKALIHEALNRARSRGAAQAYVLSDMPFYEKIGFEKISHHTFYWKKEQEE